MKNTVVALSGGVDSGVSASLLLDRGDSVRGLFMRHRYQNTLCEDETRAVLAKVGAEARLSFFRIEESGSLSRLEWSPDRIPFLLPRDASSAIEVANYLGIELMILDLDAAFSSIVDNFVDEYFLGHTPNPCVLCNRNIKFGLLLDVVKRLGADCLATGHYVRKLTEKDWLDKERAENGDVDAFWGFNQKSEYAQTPEWLTNNPNAFFFARALSKKDQSYFLYGVKSQNLDIVEFPVGGYTKEHVRGIASKKGLPIAERKDSQEICFVADKNHVDFIRKVRENSPDRWTDFPQDTSGPFLSMDGEIIGRHHGYEKYTIGQRKGLGMGFGERIFVQKILPEKCGVVLGPYDALSVDSIRAVDSNWHVDTPIDEDFRCEVKARYRNESTFATVRISRDGSFEARLDLPRFGVAPGQSLVCYWRDRLLGGGRIVE